MEQMEQMEQPAGKGMRRPLGKKQKLRKTRKKQKLRTSSKMLIGLAAAVLIAVLVLFVTVRVLMDRSLEDAQGRSARVMPGTVVLAKVPATVQPGPVCFRM